MAAGRRPGRRRRSPLRLRSGSRSRPGLAGGSSDAAAALDGALEAWARGARRRRGGWRLAAALGSDVPFFLAGGAALVEGRGERVTPLPRRSRGERPGVLLVTPAVRRPARPPSSPPASAAARRGDRRRSARELGAPRRASCGAGLDAPPASSRAPASWPRPTTSCRRPQRVVPGLVPFRRALMRLLGRPIGLSRLRADALGALSFAGRAELRPRPSARPLAAGIAARRRRPAVHRVRRPSLTSRIPRARSRR